MQRRKFIRDGCLALVAPSIPTAFGKYIMMNPAVKTFSVGDFTCTLFRDLIFTYTAEQFFMNTTPEVYEEALKPFGNDSHEIESPFVCLLLERGNQKILIDTGLGYMEETLEFQGQPMKFQGALTELLREKGITTSSITHVVMTHFHPDHIGGVCQPDKSLTFPNATYIGHEDEWKFWMSDKVDALPPIFRFFNDYNIKPLKDGPLQLLTKIEEEILPGITAIQVPGHTPGQFAVRIESEGEKLLFISDVWLHPLHIQHLDWRTIHDMDHEKAKKSRERMLELAYSEEMPVQSFHFDFPGLGNVDKFGGGWRWVMS